MKLSFGAILSESFGFFFARLGLFFHLVTVPWILSLALRILTSATTEQTLLTVLAEKAIDVIPTVMFQVAWMRLVLLGPERIERLPGLGWSRRETAFLLHLLKVAGVTFALIVAFTLTVGTIDPTMVGDAAADPDLMRREAMAAPLGIGFIVSALLALRVSFGLAATRRSWAYGRGNSWTIIGSLFGVLFAGAVATSIAVIVPLALLRNLGADTAAAIVTWTIAILVSYSSAALVATTQAVIWRRLTAWREGVPLA